MPTSRHVLLLACSACALGFPAGPTAAQPKGDVGTYSDVTIEGSILEPEPVKVSDDARLASLLTVPDGFEVSVFARDLENPRMLAVSDDGRVYATRRKIGDVVLLDDGDGDGKAETVRTVASRPGMHGIAFDGRTVFLATVNDVYTAEVQDDGSFGELTRIINDLPDSGQHPNRTLGIGPDGMLYVTVGSTCNACDESSPESATILRAEKDGTSRTIFARGLRNTIGFGWQPQTGALFGFDHGIDWLGDEEQQEEFNRIEQGKQYGWPYVYAFSQFNPQDNPPEGMSLEQWAKLSTEPVLGYTAHAAPMQMAFVSGDAWPEDYRGDALVAMRGSWNRRPPSGYEVVRVDFQDGRPTRVEPFLEGFLMRQEDGKYGYLGRPTGVAMDQAGALYVADDSNGIVYRVSPAGAAPDATGSMAETPDTVATPPAGEIATEVLATADRPVLDVTGSFERDAPIPEKHAADGDDASPALAWSGAPAEAKSFAIIVDDPDADSPKPFTHWIAYDIPADVTSLREGLPTDPILRDPEGLKQGANSRGSTGYTGPKPPVGDPAHTYHVQVFALDRETLGLDPGARRDEVLAAMKGHVLAAGTLTGTFERPSVAAR